MNPDTLSVFSNYDIKMNILLAMESLLKTCPFDKLTISAICDKAGISRATFYRYFKDKYSVAEWHVRYVHSLGVSEIGRTLTWYEGYYRTQLATFEFENFYRAICGSNDYNSVTRFAPRERRTVMLETLTDYFHVEVTDLLLFQVESVTVCEAYMLPRWDHGEIDVSLSRLCDMMCSCVPRELFSIMNAPIDPDSAGSIKKMIRVDHVPGPAGIPFPRP